MSTFAINVAVSAPQAAPITHRIMFCLTIEHPDNAINRLGLKRLYLEIEFH